MKMEYKAISLLRLGSVSVGFAIELEVSTPGDSINFVSCNWKEEKLPGDGRYVVAILLTALMGESSNIYVLKNDRNKLTVLKNKLEDRIIDNFDIPVFTMCNYKTIILIFSL